MTGVNPRDRILDPEAKLQNENQIFEATYSHKEISPGMENSTEYLNPYIPNIEGVRAVVSSMCDLC